MNKYIKFALLFLNVILISSCSFFTDEIPTSTRIKDFNTINLATNNPVEVLWTKELIPRIKAENSRDLFYTLGAVQVHLRRSQLEIYRKLSKGAMSEMAGPFTINLDKFLKSIDFDHSAQISYRSLSKESLEVLDWMSAGMNDYISQTQSQPEDMKTLGIKDEKWTALDLVRVIKFTSMDVNWTVFSQLLDFNDPSFVNKIWDLKTNEKDFFDDYINKKNGFSNINIKIKSPIDKFKNAIIDLQKAVQPKTLENLIATSAGVSFDDIKSVTKSGSNAFAINGLHTKSNSAILSNDPHLGLVIPNIWLFVVLDSPEFKTMGYVIPSFPVPVIGRNMDIAWGGTNLWGLSTYPMTLSSEDKDQIVEEEKQIRVRFWLDRKFKTYKLGAYPVLKSKDFPQLGKQDVVFRWSGYEPSDELQTFLKVNKSKNFSEFHQAFESYSVAGMTFVYGDKQGNVGRIIATSQTQVKKLKLIYDKNDFTGENLNALSLPFEYNPKNQFVTSANEYISGVNQPLSLFHAPSDRKDRMHLLFKNRSNIDLDFVKQVHGDVFSESAFELKNILVKYLMEQDWIKPDDHNYFDVLDAWGGSYDSDSKGALFFEVFIAAWSEDIIKNLILSNVKSKSTKDQMYDFLTKNFNYRKFLADSLKELNFLNENRFRIYFEKSKFALEKNKNWGNFHKMNLRHPLGNLKLLKFKYSYFEGPWAGGNETLMKAAHKLSTRNAKVSFGAQARWMTDLSSVNENYIVYLGGQDGYIGSKNINDLTSLWQKGSYLKIPFDRDQFKKISASSGQ